MNSCNHAVAADKTLPAATSGRLSLSKIVPSRNFCRAALRTNSRRETPHNHSSSAILPVGTTSYSHGSHSRIVLLGACAVASFEEHTSQQHRCTSDRVARSCS